ncbi:MAG: hypothetical protein ACTSW1_07505 [Candidatus Hodarchaeales archaeon]
MANDIKIEEAFQTIVKATNSMGSTDHVAKQIAEKLQREHRTICQNTLRLMSEIIIEMAAVDSTDGRNEASINWCKKVAEIPAYFPFI